MKVTVKSPANIAFIKYWGRKSSELNIPFNDSISMNLSDCYTITSVEFKKDLKTDLVEINGEKVSEKKLQKVTDFLEIVREMAGIKTYARVESKNNFPTAAGIASSAAAFSALALAGSRAAGLKLSQKQLSILARRGSGSACRSVVDGFAYWKKGTSHRTSYAYQLAPASQWDLADIVAVVSDTSKKASSYEGHGAATSSPYYRQRQRNLPERIEEMEKALIGKNFRKFGELLEEEAVDLHVMAMTSRPPIFYWNEGTIQVMNKLREWREQGLSGYFTMDAGANVHVICREADVKDLDKKLKALSLVKFTIVNRPAEGTKVIHE